MNGAELVFESANPANPAEFFLASPAADYLYGAIIPADGGWLAR
jgi:NAD(P)-dependent dehydrogenase (short-subunit alcohol dehydrogenase family)